MARIHCMRFSGPINSLQNSGLAHYSDAIKCNPNDRSATEERPQGISFLPSDLVFDPR